MEGNPYLPASDGLLARKSGKWAKRKHHFLRNYCGITTVSMRSRFKLVYLDVMAGPGLCEMEDTGEEFSGSPFVALDHDFTEYILIEEDAGLVGALKRRVDSHP
jgi:three-Cys-motif partner protein